MPDNTNPGADMGDIIGSTRKRLEEGKGGAASLKDLVAQIPIASELPARTAARQPLPEVPSGYFHQQSDLTPGRTITKKRPQRGPTRDETINMRATIGERQRFIMWCEERSLSFPDGLMLLLDLAEGKVSSAK